MATVQSRYVDQVNRCCAKSIRIDGSLTNVIAPKHSSSTHSRRTKFGPRSRGCCYAVSMLCCIEPWSVEGAALHIKFETGYCHGMLAWRAALALLRYTQKVCLATSNEGCRTWRRNDCLTCPPLVLLWLKASLALAPCTLCTSTNAHEALAVINF